MQQSANIQAVYIKPSGNTLKKMSAVFLMGLFCVGCGGAKTQQSAQTTEQKIDALGQRVSTIEGKVLALGLEVKAGQEQVYEVRNRRGINTGMTAHPMNSGPSGVQRQAPVAQANPKPVAQPRSAKTAPAPAATPFVPQQSATASSLNSTPKAPMGKLEPSDPRLAMNKNAPSVSSAGGPALPPETAMYSPDAHTGQGVPNSSATPNTTDIQVPQMPPTGSVGSTPSLPPQEMAQPYVAPATQTSPRKAQPTATVAGEKAAYTQALNLVRGGQSQAGRDKFQAFLATYPNSKYVPNVYYWIGESYYAQGNYNDALAAFKQVTTNFPRHHKTSDALLKAGLTYQRLGDIENAKLHYQTLISTFPRSSAARIARSKKL